MKVIITGATGMVGRGVLLECLDHTDVTEVLAIVRNPTGEKHAKLKELIHSDFSDFSTVTDQLRGYDACYATMGVSAAGMNEATYTKFTYDMTMALANTLYELNPDMTFNYVSGQGTDSSEKGRSMWARVKGKTENDIMKLGFAKSFMFRPGGIVPLRGIKSRTRMYQFFYDYFMWLLLLIQKINPNAVTDTTRIGLAMIAVSKKGYNKQILDPVDINTLAKVTE